MAFKPKNEGNAESLDYDGVNKSLIEQEEMIGFITLNVDLGIQAGRPTVSYKDPKNPNDTDKITTVKTEEEAEALINQAIEIMGEHLADKNGVDEMPEPDEEGNFNLPFEIYTSKSTREVAVFADCPELDVEYKEDEPVQYRHMFNRSYAGEINGFKFKAAPPQQGSKLWTFSPKSVLYELATKTGNKAIVEEGEDNMNIDLWLGSAVRINVTAKKGGYPAFEVSKLGKRELADAEDLRSSLVIEPMSIQFDDEVDELVTKLQSAMLRFGVIRLIKQAVDFKGSNMQKALVILEGKEVDDEDEPEEKVTKKPTTKKKVAAKETKVEEKAEEEPDETSDEDNSTADEDTKADKKAKKAAKKAKKAKKTGGVEKTDTDEDLPFDDTGS